MSELFERAWPFFPFTIFACLLLMVAPQSAPRTRKVIAIILGAGAIAGIVAAAMAGTALRELRVTNPFFRAGTPDDLHFYLINVNEAPGWQWGLCVAAILALPALMIWATAQRPIGKPRPVLQAVLVAVWILTTRTLLELTAAPWALVWAVGINWSQFVIFPVVGWLAGRRSPKFLGLLGTVFAVAMLSRVLMIALGYWASTEDWNIWANVSVVTDFQPPGFDNVDLTEASAEERWFAANAIAQAGQGVFSTVFGIVFGAVPWLIARRHFARQHG